MQQDDGHCMAARATPSNKQLQQESFIALLQLLIELLNDSFHLLLAIDSNCIIETLVETTKM